MIEIEYTGKVPSVNHMYGQRAHGGRYLKGDAIHFKNNVWALCRPYVNQLPRDIELCYSLELYGKWYNLRQKKGINRIKKIDSNNKLKALLDAVCDGLGIDDSQFFEENIIKIHREKEGFKIQIWEKK